MYTGVNAIAITLCTLYNVAINRATGKSNFICSQNLTTVCMDYFRVLTLAFILELRKCLDQTTKGHLPITFLTVIY